jgi:hypothetical protein
MIGIWMENHLVTDCICHIVNLIRPKYPYKEQQIMVRLHLRFATLHGRFTPGIEQDEENRWILNSTFSAN